ncbi:MAG TPA: response regulator, partial [Nannocystis exedens]|nr:response regulator [Nannocystis exedens]
MSTSDEMSPLMLIAAMTARSAAHSTMTGSVSLGNALVVDDSPPARLLLLHLVRELGYTAEAVGTGQECIDLATRRPFDLVLLDLVLPDINGIDVITALRENKVSARTSIVIVSSIGETRSIAACLERGADDYLTKPVNPMILRARLAGIRENRILAKQSGRQVARLEEEIRRADGLLRSILPAPVAHELQTTGAVVARRHPDVAVLFADVIGFTAYCEGKRPEDVLLDLQDLVTEFEALCRRHRVLKVKTIGDALMACGGLMDESEDATARCVELGFSLIEATARHPAGWSLRVGIHRGPVVAGIIGAQQFSYDIWGDTVNTAQRIEHHGVAGAVCVSDAARDAVPPGHTTRSVGISDVKGKGPLEIFIVSRP